MKDINELNKVIIIGTDHHNVLGTVRCFGVNGIKPYGIIVKNDDSPVWVTKSKYWQRTWEIKKESRIKDILANSFSNEKNKPVIICCSDSAMNYIDLNYDWLKQSFILPNLNNKQGAITRLMNKELQSEFLKRHNIRVIESLIVDPSIKCFSLEFSYPIILKPVMSVEGDKKDISICNSFDEFNQALIHYKEKDYQRILIQPFLSHKTEYLLTGAVSNKNISFSVCKNIRQWPDTTGSGSYSQLVNQGDILDFSYETLKILQIAGFSGPIDIEIFESQNEFIINEINWRSSGRNYVNLSNKVYSSYYYYLDVIDANNEMPALYYNINQSFVINEGADIRNVFISKKVSLISWVFQLFRSKSYSLWFWKDMKPAFIRYRYYIKKFFSQSE